MNEEELKKKIRRLSKENHTKYYDDDYGEDLEIDNDKEIERLKRILEGFQKGKLEQKKEELKFLKERCIYCMIADERIKQLQKEIGGDLEELKSKIGGEDD
jgi:hypothetical protein